MSGWNVLMYAARYGHLNVVDLLIELGVKIDLLAEVFVHKYIHNNTMTALLYLNLFTGWQDSSYLGCRERP